MITIGKRPTLFFGHLLEREALEIVMMTGETIGRRGRGRQNEMILYGLRCWPWEMSSKELIQNRQGEPLTSTPSFMLMILMMMCHNYAILNPLLFISSHLNCFIPCLHVSCTSPSIKIFGRVLYLFICPKHHILILVRKFPFIPITFWTCHLSCHDIVLILFYTYTYCKVLAVL